LNNNLSLFFIFIKEVLQIPLTTASFGERLESLLQPTHYIMIMWFTFSKALLEYIFMPNNTSMNRLVDDRNYDCILQVGYSDKRNIYRNIYSSNLHTKIIVCYIKF